MSAVGRPDHQRSIHHTSDLESDLSDHSDDDDDVQAPLLEG